MPPDATLMMTLVVLFLLLLLPLPFPLPLPFSLLLFLFGDPRNGHQGDGALPHPPTLRPSLSFFPCHCRHALTLLF